LELEKFERTRRSKLRTWEVRARSRHGNSLSLSLSLDDERGEWRIWRENLRGRVLEIIIFVIFIFHIRGWIWFPCWCSLSMFAAFLFSLSLWSWFWKFLLWLWMGFSGFLWNRGLYVDTCVLAAEDELFLPLWVAGCSNFYPMVQNFFNSTPDF
jgi:hypothetical protein